MALFPDGMVCGFGPADRSNGGRDETNTHTHTQWLFCCLTWTTEPADTFSHTHILKPPTHTWERDKLLVEFSALYYQWWLWNRIKSLTSRTKRPARNCERSDSSSCVCCWAQASVRLTVRVTICVSACECCFTDSSPWPQHAPCLFLSFFASHVLSHSLGLLPP